MSPEPRWLFDCLRAGERSLRPPPPQTLDWDALVAAAEACDVAPALAFVLAHEQAAAMPRDLRQRLDRHFATSCARHVWMTRALAGVLDAMDEAGISPIVLKGPVLAETIYPHPAVRPFTDLDLLIRPPDIEHADRVLRRVGFARVADAHSFAFDVAYDGSTLYESAAGVRVDLHWRLFTEPRYRWNERESATVWERAVRVRVAGRSVLTLSPEDAVLFLAVHLAVHHGLGGVLWHWDLALIVERWRETLDWAALISRASEWQVCHALCFALRSVEHSCGVEMPARVMRSLAPRGVRAMIASRLVRSSSVSSHGGREYLSALLLTDRDCDVVAALRTVLCPPAAWLKARYAPGAASLPTQYLAHWFRMARTLTGRPDDLVSAEETLAHLPAQQDHA